ncbi:DUF1876 domain-containing protein [Nocardia sp. NPDC050630]|jgi:hypothetical protein|uniref:DUF1876 domain-containing protein n=1 Tax=unclassified Nocardia TaxID=2637762 RepID=UPI0037AF5EBD
MPSKTWNIAIAIEEIDRLTKVKAQLLGRDDGPLIAAGSAHANPADENVPAIGDELACARALQDLAHQLLYAAIADIEAHTHKPVQGLRG